MNERQATTRVIPLWTILLIAVAALVLAAVALTATVVGRSPFGMMGGIGMMGGTGMMRGSAGGGSVGGWGVGNDPQPGASGFVAGTVASPRVIRVIAGPGYAFTPSTITVARGETVTFQVTTMGPTVHEFMVGPADVVAADREGTPEVADIGMMQTKAITFTFDGAGPYAFACHADGHYEAGMRGTITLVG
jgi:plastocyanin